MFGLCVDMGNTRARKRRHIEDDDSKDVEENEGRIFPLNTFLCVRTFHVRTVRCLM